MFDFPAAIVVAPRWLTTANDSLYHSLNGLAGHSPIFDQLLGLGLSSNLVKAGLISACFLFAWMSGSEPYITAARRKVLMITLLSSVLVLATTKTISNMVFLPRPYVTSEQTYHLDGDRLVEGSRATFRVPTDAETQKTYREMLTGDVDDNDLRSFPSDHAAFFFCIALGIWMAHRRAGLVALLWTALVPLLAKMVFGQHTPLDIAAGALIAVVVLLTMQWVLARVGDRLLEYVASWTLRNTALSAAILFLALFEITNTLDDVRQIGKVGKDVTKYVAGRTQDVEHAR
jgi:membrane-associated phospholipid phosphatase